MVLDLLGADINQVRYQFGLDGILVNGIQKKDLVIFALHNSRQLLSGSFNICEF